MIGEKDQKVKNVKVTKRDYILYIQTYCYDFQKSFMCKTKMIRCIYCIKFYYDKKTVLSEYRIDIIVMLLLYIWSIMQSYDKEGPKNKNKIQ